jgi:hypothetical protein
VNAIGAENLLRKTVNAFSVLVNMALVIVLPTGNVTNQTGNSMSSNQSKYAQTASEARIDVIGQNGNDGQHYALDPSRSSLAKLKVNPADVLKAGAQHMEDRAATYDNPQGERSIPTVVKAFNAITSHTLTAEEAWLFMILLKAVRSQQGNFKLDNYEDGAAYFALMAEEASNPRS